MKLRSVIITLLLITALLSAQTQQSISGGQLMQAALANGVVYIVPSAAQNIQNQKSFFSWPSLTSLILGDGSIGAVTAGAAKIISISPVGMVVLALVHWAYDQYITPIVAAGQANAASGLSAMLTTSTVINPGLPCPDFTLYASSIHGVTLSTAKKSPPSPITVNINGSTVTYAPQVGNGLKSKKFIPVDVMVCPVSSAVTVPTVKPAYYTTSQSGIKSHALDMIMKEKNWQIEQEQHDSEIAELVALPNTYQRVMPIHVEVKPAVDLQAKIDELQRELDLLRKQIQ